MPRTIKTQDELDREVMRGGPSDPAPNEDNLPDDSTPDDKKPTIEEQLEAMRLENVRLKGQIDGLSRRDPAPQPTPPPAPKPKRDWEKMLFEDTENAVKTLTADITDEVTSKLTGAYQADVGLKEFWRDFWDENKDLKKDQDGDIAEIILNRNYKAMADLPVSEAIKKLGDLTRERIMKYTGAKKKEPDPKEKARAEAGGERKPPKAEPEEDKIVSLGDLIKARRANRLAAVKKAQTA